jgi:polar amino acid transport system substrate-binding protein
LTSRMARKRGFDIRVLSLLAILTALLAGCSNEPTIAVPGAQRILTPSGKLRVGLYPGTPTSVIVDPATKDAKGVGHDLGREMAQRLGVPFEPVVFLKNADLLAALKSGNIDVAFTNSSPARAKDMDFSEPYLAIELGLLVRPGVAISTIEDLDRPGLRVGVTEKSSSDEALSRSLRHAVVFRAATIKIGGEMLAEGRIDAYATNKATLFEMGDKLPGARVLDGRWGVEHHAVAIPKGRSEGLPFVRKFADDVKAEGLVQRVINRVGLRGASTAE